MIKQPKIERAFRLREPNVRFVEIHELDCHCPACAPYVPSDPDRLTASDLGKIAAVAAAVGSAIMFAINPAGASAALFATIGIGL